MFSQPFKTLFILFSAALVLWACHNSEQTGENIHREIHNPPEFSAEFHANQETNGKPFRRLFTLADAGKILGQPAHLSDSATRREGHILTYQSAYKANAEYPETSKTGAVYFLVERYENAAAAHKGYAAIKTGNESHQGIKVLNDLGDEAYFHSDGTNFYFIMVRKGNYAFRIKVNKITGTTSRKAFDQVAREITEEL